MSREEVGEQGLDAHCEQDVLRRAAAHDDAAKADDAPHDDGELVVLWWLGRSIYARECIQQRIQRGEMVAPPTGEVHIASTGIDVQVVLCLGKVPRRPAIGSGKVALATIKEQTRDLARAFTEQVHPAIWWKQ